MDSMTRFTVGAMILVSVLGGCIGTSPEQQAADALGPDTGPYDRGPNHRAGFPCVTCHGGLWWQPTPSFELAGTIYQRAGSSQPSSNASVEVMDASGHQFTAATNSVGNFFVMRGGSQPTQYGEGRFDIPWPLAYPLRVRVKGAGGDQQMRSQIWREKSCATCHRGQPSADSNGRIFVEEPVP